MNKSLKLHKSVEAQIELLKSRGLIICEKHGDRNNVFSEMELDLERLFHYLERRSE